MRATLALAVNELRLLRNDPVPAVVLVAMPIVLMVLLTPALSLALAAEGHLGASGAEQSVPGMICVFSFFGVALVGFALFREHGWRTWVRLRAAGLSSASAVAGLLAVPAGLLAVQHVVLLATGVVFLDLEVTSSWWALIPISLTFIALVLTMGLAAAAVLGTIQQLNAVTNLGAMVLGGLGGGFVPVSTLPGWLQPLAPISPAYWAMRAYRAVLLEGQPRGAVLTSVAVMAAVAVAFAGIAIARLRLDRPKRTWG
jgi:ABC-2 type transport system permease protein